VADEKKISLQHDVKDLETVRKHFKIDKCSLIGYSYLGMMVVLYSLDHPQHVERIIQLGPVPMTFSTEYPKELTATDTAWIVDSAEMQKLRDWEKQGYHKEHPKEFCELDWKVMRYRLIGDPAHVERLGPAQCDIPNEWWMNFERHLRIHFGGIQKFSFPKEKLASLNMPVLTIHGTRDRNAPYGAGREWALNLPNAKLLTIEGAGHQSWADDPDKVLSAMDGFLKGAWPKGAEKVTALTRSAH
jgi:proline iminopeptidase